MGAAGTVSPQEEVGRGALFRAKVSPPHPPSPTPRGGGQSAGLAERVGPVERLRISAALPFKKRAWFATLHDGRMGFENSRGNGSPCCPSLLPAYSPPVPRSASSLLRELMKSLREDKDARSAFLEAVAAWEAVQSGEAPVDVS